MVIRVNKLSKLFLSGFWFCPRKSFRQYHASFFPIVIILITAIVLHFSGQISNDGIYIASSTGEHGVSLFFDTLQHMGYPVEISRRPVNINSDKNHVNIIIQPQYFNASHINDLLEWVRHGGRLIFMSNTPIISEAIISYIGTRFGSLIIYEIGNGILVTGNSLEIINQYLMHSYSTGTLLHSIINHWDADIIFFAEYYHGPRSTQNLFARLPLIIRLIFMQLALVGIMIVWYVGKRFGNAIPYYEEHEREENEHVFALTRLYMKTMPYWKKQKGEETND